MLHTTTKKLKILDITMVLSGKEMFTPLLLLNLTKKKTKNHRYDIITCLLTYVYNNKNTVYWNIFCCNDDVMH